LYDGLFYYFNNFKKVSSILSIGTAVPQYCHRQEDILQFMQTVYAANDVTKRKLRYLYSQSGIRERYSVLADYSRPGYEWKFYSPSENLEPFPSLEQRMATYNKQAPLLSVDAVRDCLGHKYHPDQVTHLITVSCTGMSAPGLDLQLSELLELDKTTWRTSVNFMGCYAAIHALKIADAICTADQKALVLVVCTELCTLHFQKEPSIDNITSSMLFGDGSAAVLVSGKSNNQGISIDGFYSEVVPKGKRDMAWELSSSGFLMTLSGYVPDLIEQDFEEIVNRALLRTKLSTADISHWCIHPGGKRILEVVGKSLRLNSVALTDSYKILADFGNLSSASILFVMKRMMQQRQKIDNLFVAAFGPGLTIETFTAH
jgi:predicted naringenin-chalcone synthase